MDYLEALSKLNKKQKKDILNIIAEDRIDEYGVAGKAANLGDRAFSILGGSGNNIRLNPTEEEKFISLAMESLKPKRKGKAEGGLLMDDQMLIGMTPLQETEIESEMPMKSDDDMEDGYTRFIMEEALSEEEEDMLVSKLEQDEELQMLFDKVINVAQEFAGNGPVEGPGTGVSDDIPARLSDGEFVFTAKAVEEIGEDSLMSMMKDAEAAADERQGLAEGGMPEETNTKSLLTQSGIVQEDTIAEDELKKRMVQGSSSYVRS